jgi:hypothetical protein
MRTMTVGVGGALGSYRVELDQLRWSQYRLGPDIVDEVGEILGRGAGVDEAWQGPRLPGTNDG